MAHAQSGTVSAHFTGTDGLARTLVAPASRAADGNVTVSADHRNVLLFAILEAGLLPSEVDLHFVESDASKKANAALARGKALHDYVERLFNVEQSFADQRAEYNDTKNDLKTEIKERAARHGITFDEVRALVKIRLDEQSPVRVRW